MCEQLNNFQDLKNQLHEVNREFARAAQLLYRTTDLNNEHWQTTGTQLRAVQARWESMTQGISHLLGTGRAAGFSRQNTTKADRDEN